MSEPTTEAGRLFVSLERGDEEASEALGIHLEDWHWSTEKLVAAIEAEARASLDVERLRDAAENLCKFAGRFSAGDIDVDRGDLQTAIDDVRAALRSKP